MKSYFLPLSLCFCLINPISCLGKVPSIPLHPKIAEQLFGAGGPNQLDCNTMGSYNWVPPDAQVNALCNEAQIACIRYGLLVRSIKEATATAGAQQDLPLVVNDAQLKLRGCQVASYYVITTGQGLLNASGYAP